MPELPPKRKIDPELSKYHGQLRKKLKVKAELKPIRKLTKEIMRKHDGRLLPSFCKYHSEDISKKKILAVLQDPGNSGAKNSMMCSIWNKDTTAKRQRRVVVEKLKMNLDEILFWNFYPFFGWQDINDALEPKDRICQKVMCAEELRKLAKLMKNLRVIVVCGNEAWEGMKFFKPIQGVSMLWVPHPSNRGVMSNGGLSKKEKCRLLKKGWKIAREIVNG